MQAESIQPSHWINYAVALAVVAIVVVLRLQRLGRTRRLKLEWLWIVPALYAVAAVGMFASFPPTPIGWALSALALAIGGALGWQRGRLMHIEVDPQTHALNQKASPGAVLFIVALIAVRMAAHAMAEAERAYMHLNAMALTDILIAFALGIFAVQRLEMFLRARRLLQAARATA